MTAVIQTPRRKTDHVRAMMVVSKARVEFAMITPGRFSIATARWC